MAAAVDWRVFCIIFAFFLVAVICTRYVSLGSVLGGASFAVSICAFYWGNWVVCALGVFAGVFVIVRPRTNIVRLLHHQEAKLTCHRTAE